MDGITRKRQRTKDNDLNLSTWNVRTMLQSGKMQEIANETIKYRLDVVALQELRWKGSGQIDKKNFSLYFSGPNNRTGQYGTGFLLGKKARRSCLSFEPCNERIRLKGTFRNITLVSALAPTEDKEDVEKEIFYDMLRKFCEDTPKYDILILMGDFNAKIEEEEWLRGVAGKYYKHSTTSENGKLLSQLALSHNLVIKITCFAHKKIHKGTWKILGSVEVNQIDHVLISGRHSTSIIDVRTCRAPNCDSDHYLVKAVLREKLSNIQKAKNLKRERWDTDKLKATNLQNLQIRKNFQNSLERKLEGISQQQEVETVWSRLKTVMKEAEEENVGTVKRGRNEDWFDDQCREAITKKNVARQNMLQKETRQKCEEYRKRRLEANKLCRSKKRKAEMERLKELEEVRCAGQVRWFYQMINREKGTFMPKLVACKDKNGKILAEKEAILDKWAEYFEDTLNDEQNFLST